MSEEKESVGSFVIEELKDPCAKIATLYAHLMAARKDGVESSKVREVVIGTVNTMLAAMMDIADNEILPMLEELKKTTADIIGG